MNLVQKQVESDPKILTPQALSEIESAALMIDRGLPVENVLRMLYILAFLAGWSVS